MPSLLNGLGPFLQAAGMPFRGHAPMPHTFPPTRSAPLHEVGFPYDRRAPLRDGVCRSTDDFLPSGTEPWPGLLLRVPCESLRERWVRWAIWWAQRVDVAVV